MRQKTIVILGILGAIILLLISQKVLLVRPISLPSGTQPSSTPSQNSTQPNESPKILSTKPDPLDQAVISSDQQIEIVFNRGLENEGEFKIRIEPKVKYKITLSGDHKTAKITPEESYELGVGYTMFITGDTKFEGVGPWGEEKTFHFQTIKYRGI
ncbi:hypothetical protein HYS96_00865 [Candidatus Daviesbacteria bacterium]|nr:hypothetical protein [Candidatus Daviesbacteria bacterium]